MSESQRNSPQEGDAGQVGGARAVHSPKRAAVRLGHGEYTFPSPGVDPAAAHARAVFLTMLAEIAPEVLSDLYARVSPVYEATLETSGLSRSVLSDWGAISRASPAFRPALIPLHQAIVAWAASHNLMADWIYERALETLATPVKGKQKHWVLRQTTIRSPIAAAESRFKFEHDGWKVAEQPASDARKEITQAFTTQLKEYFKKLDSLAQERGGRPTNEGRGEANRAHFEMYIRWQVQRWVKPVIARRYHLGRQKRSRGARGEGASRDTGVSSVTAAVQRVGTLIGITPRTGDPGRPRKSRGLKQAAPAPPKTQHQAPSV